MLFQPSTAAVAVRAGASSAPAARALCVAAQRLAPLLRQLVSPRDRAAASSAASFRRFGSTPAARCAQAEPGAAAAFDGASAGDQALDLQAAAATATAAANSNINNNSAGGQLLTCALSDDYAAFDRADHTSPNSNNSMAAPGCRLSVNAPAPTPVNAMVMPPPSPSKRPRSDSFADLAPVASRHEAEASLKAALAAPASPGAVAAAPAAVSSSGANLAKALKSVVKIFCTSANPNFSLPWQMMAQTKSTASGFVVAPLPARRILTNAHAVANQVQVMVRRAGNARKFPARVLAVSHEADIAQLTVDNDEFWTGEGGVEALELGALPAMQESVMVVGFPQGGDNVCVTKGVVSRLDRQQYSHGRCALLTTQTDAPINSGNSGGPVLLNDKLAGIAFQSLIGAENTGYVIPIPVVQHFLEDLDRHAGKYTGFPELGISWQSLESTDMKASLAMPAGLTGVYITGTEPVFEASKVLRAGDVLTHVSGHAIADDGTFLFPDHKVRIDFRHLPSMAFDGDCLQLGVWRDGAAQALECRVAVPRHLVPLHCHDERPRYFIFAGLVFTNLTNFYLRHQYGADWSTKAPIKLCDRYFSGSKEADGQEVVLLSKVLSSDVNQGFQEIGNVQVYKVNGVKVHNLQHLARLVDSCEAPFVRFDLDWKRVVVLDTAKAKAATADILRTNCIASAASEGLLSQDLCLPADVSSVVQPTMADTEVVAGDEAVAVGEGKAKTNMARL
ncbi:hypothetical protein HYH03_000835 [Edaphochlamys debaryana]|uniref:Protease Do-like PDZ domain-containing protein n=1 Tax=Edaphochlamys debaryana TaxID=47281 RepID=A0A835YDR2_9CHLO|nr:hypothetical protein HYH03_000835 [Edaphochlamys debaryana]|eukprot:KAG2501015.1 hypothetical protein HYH03_000835 [Edaphochlamys debaryana]